MKLKKSDIRSLKWDELQFAARNVAGYGALIGAKTKAGNYAVVHLDTSTKTPLLQATVELNRWSWNLL